jgi:hypothetical protein
VTQLHVGHQEISDSRTRVVLTTGVFHRGENVPMQTRVRIPSSFQPKRFPGSRHFSAPVGEIQFTVDDEKRTVFTRALGTISCVDYLNHVFAKAQAGILSYAELFDIRNAVFNLAGIELPLLAGEVRRIMGRQKPFKVAIVTNDPLISNLVRKYADTIGEDERRFRVFGDLQDALLWIGKPCLQILRL